MAGGLRITRLYLPDREREKRALLLLLDGVAASMISQTEASKARDGAMGCIGRDHGESHG